MLTRRDPDSGAAPGGAPGNPGDAPAFDPEKFKNEMLESNKQLMASMSETLTGTIKATVEGMMAGRGGGGDDEADDPPSSDASKEFKGEFADEMAELGLDEKQAASLATFVDKLLKKKAPSIKDDVIDTVDKNTSVKEARQTANTRVAQQYPEILNPGSALRDAANRIYANYSKAEQASPEAMAHATRSAAAELGIAPLTKEQIRQHDSRNPTGGTPTTKSDAPSKADFDFAAAFGVSKDKFAENMKIVQMKRRG